MSKIMSKTSTHNNTNKIALAIVAVLLFIGIGGLIISTSSNKQSPLKDPFRDSRLTLSDTDLGRVKQSVFSGNYKDFKDNAGNIAGLQISKSIDCQNFNPQQECINFMLALDSLTRFSFTSPEELQKDKGGYLGYLFGKEEVKKLQDEAKPKTERRIKERDEIIALLKTGISTKNSTDSGKYDFKKTETNLAIDKIQAIIDRGDCENVFFDTKYNRIKCESSIKSLLGCPSKVEASNTTTLQDLKLEADTSLSSFDCYSLSVNDMLGRYLKLTETN
jgi:hypothetical protein